MIVLISPVDKVIWALLQGSTFPYYTSLSTIDLIYSEGRVNSRTGRNEAAYETYLTRR